MRTEDLEALVVHAIVEHRSDEDLWYQLCKGTRTPQEVASIRRAHESPEALATKLVLFSPAPACVREATLRHLQREHASTSRSPDSTRTISEPVPLLEARRRRGGSVGTVLRVVVAIAAVVLLWRLARPGPRVWLPLSKPSQSTEGVLKIQQPMAQLRLQPGIWTLTFHVSLEARGDGARAPQEVAIESIVCVEDRGRR